MKVDFEGSCVPYERALVIETIDCKYDSFRSSFPRTPVALRSELKMFYIRSCGHHCRFGWLFKGEGCCICSGYMQPPNYSLIACIPCNRRFEKAQHDENSS
jgi:hypothetical protein